MEIVLWLDQRISAIRMCLDSSFVEEALVLLYSAIGTIGFLNAPANAVVERRGHFVDWCDKYVVPLLPPNSPQGIDLYGARCGMLHVSSAESDLARGGKAREVWYRFGGRAGVNLSTNTPQPALVVDIELLVSAFGEGGRRLVGEIGADPARLKIAHERASAFFRWGILR